MVHRILVAVRQNVVAWLALFVALGGTSIAASHYLITSTKQIKPSVLKQLRGRRGLAGATGAGGSQGVPGPEGRQGPEGKAGLDGGELATLRSILPYIRFVPTGVAGKPTIQFSGVNLQLLSGSGSTSGPVNGEGNLVLGYDEHQGSGVTQTGSHDLILGRQQTFTSYGGIIAGFYNEATAPSTFVVGLANLASGRFASISGGRNNVASGEGAAVSGGYLNNASGEASAVSGGEGNGASGTRASLGGGSFNSAGGEGASVGGGFKNSASGGRSSIFGGKELEAKLEYEAIP